MDVPSKTGDRRSVASDCSWPASVGHQFDAGRPSRSRSMHIVPHDGSDGKHFFRGPSPRVSAWTYLRAVPSAALASTNASPCATVTHPPGSFVNIRLSCQPPPADSACSIQRQPSGHSLHFRPRPIQPSPAVIVAGQFTILDPVDVLVAARRIGCDRLVSSGRIRSGFVPPLHDHWKATKMAQGIGVNREVVAQGRV